MKKAPGVYIIDDRTSNTFPTPLDVSNKDDVAVGRIRRDVSQDGNFGYCLTLFSIEFVPKEFFSFKLKGYNFVNFSGWTYSFVEIKYAKELLLTLFKSLRCFSDFRSLAHLASPDS